MENKTLFHDSLLEKPNTIEMKLSVISFTENNTRIIYCPALDISGYGNSDKEAEESFKIVIEEFIRYTTSKNTLHSELVRMGWKITNNHQVKQPDLTYLLSQNKNFSRIFNTHSFRKYNETISIPAF